MVPARPPPSMIKVIFSGGVCSVMRTLPWYDPFTGPTASSIWASKVFGPVGVSDFRPGVALASTSGSLSVAHTFSRGAGIRYSPSIFMRGPPGDCNHRSHYHETVGRVSNATTATRGGEGG